MGRDKAAIRWGDGTLLSHVVDVALTRLDRVLVVGRSAPDGWERPAVAFAPDDDGLGSGPLAGLVSGLRRAPDGVVALACDLPQLTVSALDWLLDTADLHRLAPALVPVCQGRLEPLFAVYRPPVLDVALARVAAGQRSLRGLLGAIEAVRVELPEALAGALHNVNTPADLADAAEST